MESRSVAPRLGRRFLLIALLVAVVPLGAIGFWATRGAARSGRLLLRSQLESQLEQVRRELEQRWNRYQADLLMLGENEPVRLALRDTTGAPRPVPEFVQRTFAQVTAFNRVSIHDRAGLARWTLVGATPNSNGREFAAASESRGIEVRVPITDLAAGDAIGEVRASLRVADLLLSATTLANPSGPLTALFIRNGRAVVPAGADEQLFTDESVKWSGYNWLAVRQASGVPGVELVMAAPLDPFVAPFERAARNAAAALLAAAGVVVVLMVALTRRMTREVERELAQREALARVGEFASELSHEVRNPLTAIRLDLQRVEESATDPDTVRTILAGVLRQIERLDRAVTGALRIARGGSIEQKRVDLRETLESALRAAQPELVQRGGRSALEINAKDKLEIDGDAGALEQLFLNLLLNAAQALGPGGEVRVTTARCEAGIEVIVADNGRGMTPEQLRRIEQPYRSSRRDGNGLGLKIARRIVASHQGELEVRSAPGAGTTVRVLLNCNRRPARGDPLPMPPAVRR